MSVSYKEKLGREMDAPLLLVSLVEAELVAGWWQEYGIFPIKKEFLRLASVLTKLPYACKMFG